MSVMEAHVNRELVRYAVQCAITCGCGRILDLDNAVLITGTNGQEAVSCGHCYDAAKDRLAAQSLVQSVIDARPALPTPAKIAGTKQTIRVKFPKGKRVAVAATVYGPLAVHRALGLTGEVDTTRGYTVTHLATGLAVLGKLTATDARTLAQALVSLDWNFTAAKAMPRATKDAAIAAFQPFLSRRLR